VHVAHDLEAGFGRSTMNPEFRAAADGVGIGARDQDRELRAARARDEPLVTVDVPLVAWRIANVWIPVGSLPRLPAPSSAKHERT